MLFLQKQCLQCCGLLFSRTVKLDTRSRAQHLHHNNIYFKTSKPHSVGPDWRSCCDPRPKWWLSQSLNSPKGNSLIRTSFASPGASGLFFRSPTIEITETGDGSRFYRGIYFKNQPAVFYSLPRSFLVHRGICRIYQTCFRGIYNVFSELGYLQSSLSPQSFSVSSSMLTLWLFINLRTGDLILDLRINLIGSYMALVVKESLLLSTGSAEG